MVRSHEKFRISEVFEEIDVQKTKGQARDFPEQPTGESVIPLLTSHSKNQGLSRYAKRQQYPETLKNVMSVSANAKDIAFYQDKEFAILQDAYAY